MRKTDRNFLVDFAALDIEYLPQKGPKVFDDIQMVYVMGTVAPAAAAGGGFTPGYGTPDPILVQYGVQFFENAVVGEKARIELLAIATGGGLWIDMMTGSGAQLDSEFFSIAALSGLGTTLLPTAANSSAFGTGAAATAILDHGTSVVAAPANAWRGKTGQNANNHLTPYDTHFPIYIAAGRVFVVQEFTANLGVTWGLVWQEIP